MRTTIRLNDQLLRDAKSLAAKTGRSLTSVIEDSLRQTLSHQESAEDQAQVKLHTVSGNGLKPGVDLDNSAKLLDLLERADVSD
jgi:hypothetical protein